MDFNFFSTYESEMPFSDYDDPWFDVFDFYNKRNEPKLLSLELNKDFDKSDLLVDNYLKSPYNNQQQNDKNNPNNINSNNSNDQNLLNFLWNGILNLFQNNSNVNQQQNQQQQVHQNYNTTSTGTFNNKNDFINALNSTYRQVLLEKGLDPEYSYVLTASAVMESGWGTRVSGKFNYGGVKAKKGSVKSTIDYVDGKYIRRNQTFRDFNSIKDYCNYVVNLLSGEKYYHNAFSKFPASKPLEFWRYVLDSGYGGGDDEHKSKYVDSVRKIINTIKSNVNVIPMKSGYNAFGQPIQQQQQISSNYTNTPRKVDTNSPLIHIDIEDLLKQQGITSVNGKAIKFGRRGLRPKGSKYGSKNSWHYVWNPYTKSATARDISIINGSDHDYDTFRKMLLGNKTVVSWMKANGWGIINELTKEILSRTKGTGRHFHFGPDNWARRTWNAWLSDPNIPVTKAI